MKILVVLFTLFSGYLFAQIPNFKIDSLLLEKTSIDGSDIIGFTRKSCTGFGVNSIGYLISSKDSIAYLQKFDFREYPKEELVVYEKIILNKNIFYDILISNRKNLKRDESIKGFKVQGKDEMESGVVNTWKPMISHSCYRRIYLKKRSKKYDVEFNYFDLARSLGNSEDLLNINYTFNKRRKIVEIDSVLNDWITQLENSQQFVIVKD